MPGERGPRRGGGGGGGVTGWNASRLNVDEQGVYSPTEEQNISVGGSEKAQGLRMRWG